MSFSPYPSIPIGNNIQEQRDRWGRKQIRTAHELIQTEQCYCKQLELVTTYFVEILKAKGTLSQDIRASIFSSIKSIYSVTQSLLVHLENGYSGRGFEQLGHQLHHYTTYVDNFHYASKVLGVQLKKSKAFRRFKKLQEARPEFNNCRLEDLLPLPLHRIQEYQRFLEYLTENTSPSEPEFQQHARALKAILEVSQRIQDNTRSYENHLNLRRVQKLLKGQKTKVMAPGRWYIREGWLRTVPSKGAEAKPKMFFLFSDVLLQAKRCSPLQPTNGDKFEAQCTFSLMDCTVDRVFGHTKSRGGLLSLTFPEAKLLLMSSDQEDINDWYSSFTSAIRKLQSKNTVVHRRDEMCRKPLRSTTDSSHNTPAACISPERTHNMIHDETSGWSQAASGSRSHPDSKRMNWPDAALQPGESTPEPEGVSCVIL
ncbi:rho guanine nucleotide exchange factor 39 [Lampris incognitus]|uniref:rho guanine nucleotide exchange factor 39 n=1 Tax=Lampris incognitus TaxID=2546036 RepID=UPI0024B50F96|nr:rho guanine nucleotide exchange factor 39 [Lampris incognitus]